MNAHTHKPQVIATLDGIYRLGPDGHYKPFHPKEEKYPGIGWYWLAYLIAIVGGAAWAWLG